MHAEMFVGVVLNDYKTSDMRRCGEVSVTDASRVYLSCVSICALGVDNVPLVPTPALHVSPPTSDGTVDRNSAPARTHACRW
jgi:hypothetical protein